MFSISHSKDEGRKEKKNEVQKKGQWIKKGRILTLQFNLYVSKTSFFFFVESTKLLKNQHFLKEKDHLTSVTNENKVWKNLFLTKNILQTERMSYTEEFFLLIEGHFE